MHADRTNRTVLTLLGLLLLLTGAAGLVASVGGFGKAFSHTALFDNLWPPFWVRSRRCLRCGG